MQVSELTEQNAKYILTNILELLESQPEWDAETIDDVVDQLQCDQGKLWTTDAYGRFRVDRPEEKTREALRMMLEKFGNDALPGESGHDAIMAARLALGECVDCGELLGEDWEASPDGPMHVSCKAEKF